MRRMTGPSDLGGPDDFGQPSQENLSALKFR